MIKPGNLTAGLDKEVDHESLDEQLRLIIGLVGDKIFLTDQPSHIPLPHIGYGFVTWLLRRLLLELEQSG